MGDFAQSQFPHLLTEWGYGAILIAVVADSFGLPIPGEAMLILASVYAGASHHLILPLVMGAAAVGAVFGDNVTYALGYRGGYPLVRRYGERLHLGPRRLKIGQYLFRTYGRGIVFLGRLIPVLHIWTAVLAGVNRMSWPRFALANAVGAVTWAALLGLAGYAFGRAAEHAGGVIAGAAVPIAIAIGLLTMLLLRLNERRLYARAEEAMGDEPRSRTR